MSIVGWSGLGISWLITWMVIPGLMRLSDTYRLFDLPGEERKLHTRNTPYLGGLAMLIGCLAGSFLAIYATAAPLPSYAATLFIMTGFLYLTGLLDDFFSLRPSIRFLIQFLCGGFLVYNSNLLLPIDQVLGFTASIPYGNLILTVIIFSAITNAFNLIDGMDGLAGVLGLLASAAYSVINFLEGDIFYFIIASSMTGALLGFLIYNRPVASIFMGDNGSYLLGFLLSILTINFISNTTIPDLSTGQRFQIGLALIAVPSLDLVRVFLVRILHGQSPFVPDRSHIHHILLDIGFSVYGTLMVVTGITALVVCGAFLTLEKLTFLEFALSTTGLYLTIFLILRKVRMTQTGIDRTA